MKQSKSSKRRDRLSELPDALILVILSLLPMRDVVRTTLLSKRWKDLWTTVPCLNFEDHSHDCVRFQNYVNRALIRWKGTKILKFDIGFCYEESAASDLDFWIRLAVENDVEELNVNLLNYELVMFDDGDATGYWAPQRLYVCSSIRKLSLVACNVKIHGNVLWNQLKCLTIEAVRLSEHVFNQVMSGTPQLEVLILRLIESYENLNIQSSSLRKLMIEKHLLYGEDAAKDTVLTIWAPNVGKLEISGILYNKCLLMNVSSLTDALLNLHPNNVFLFGDQLHGEMMLQVLRSISHVEKVTLSNYCIKVLGMVKKKDLLSRPSDAKFLKLYGLKVEEIVNLLDMFPKLTMLNIEIIDEVKDYLRKPPVIFMFDEENPLSSCLLHLRTVEIDWFAYDASIYLFMEFLLRHACMLEKLKFCPTLIGPHSWSSIKQKLKNMPRSSPKAKVIMCKYG